MLRQLLLHRIVLGNLLKLRRLYDVIVKLVQVARLEAHA